MCVYHVTFDAVYAAYNVSLIFLQEFDWWSIVFQTLRRTCSQNPVLIMVRLSAILIHFKNRFIEVFEETKPLIKLR